MPGETELQQLLRSMSPVLLEHDYVFSEAVGLTATVSGVLAENGISANVIAAYFHDHIFVPSALADKALGILLALNTNGEPP